MRTKGWLGLAVLLAVAGCTGGAKDEAEAMRELQAKPMTDEQKQTIEKIKQGGPPPSAHAGATKG